MYRYNMDFKRTQGGYNLTVRDTHDTGRLSSIVCKRFVPTDDGFLNAYDIDDIALACNTAEHTLIDDSTDGLVIDFMCYFDNGR